MTQPEKTPWWQIVSRVSGLTILFAVLIGWQRGLSISDPGVLVLEVIAAGLLGVDVAAVLRRNGRNGGGGTGSQ